MPYLTTEKKAKFFTDFGGAATNTGSIEGQIALLTERISQISSHLLIGGQVAACNLNIQRRG